MQPPQPPQSAQKLEPLEQAESAVAGLPYSSGLSFSSLDEYLAHLERRGAYDVPWYRQVSPGVYEVVAGRRVPGQPAERYTRQQLQEKFGLP